MHEGVLLKKALLLNSAQSWKLWQVYYGSHLQLKVHSSAFEILAPGHKSGTWSVEGKGGRQRWRSANSALAAFRKQPRVHRIVMDYVQGLKSGSRAKMSWQRAGGRRRAENGFHVTAVAEAKAAAAVVSWIWLLALARRASCNHSCNAMMKPVESSSSFAAQLRRGCGSYEIRMKRPGCVFSSVKRPQSRALPLWQVWKTRLHICFSSLRIQDFTNFVAL